MKSIYIISILLFVMSLSVLGQYTVETPWGSTVNVWTQDDQEPEDRDEMDDDYADEYPDAEFHTTIPDLPNYPNLSSTSKFNCHGYAWHMYWLGSAHEFDAPWNMNDTEADNYFNDPSFKECAKANADIWWINGGTHSALATGTTDELLSKWGIGPMATHGIENDDSPYPITSVTYYKKCYREASGDYYSDITLDHCKVKFNNTNVHNYVDLEIEFEDWLIIEGTFTTGTGTTLYIHPD